MRLWVGFVVSILVLVCVPLRTDAAVSPANNLGIVGWWPFNEGTSTVAHDISGYSNNGAIVTSPSSWASGKRGKALSFDGTNQYVEVSQGSSANLNLSSYSSFTISSWVYLTDTSVGHAFYGTGNPYNNAGSGTIVSYGYPSANQFGWQINNGSGSPLGGSFGSVSTRSPNQWIHMTLVYTSTTLSLYLNGAFISTVDISTKGIAGLGNNPFRIGAYGNSPVSQKWQGYLDDFRIYSRALSASEITSLYQVGQVTRQTISQSGLVGWWTFDEATSTIAHDFSGQGNNGALSGIGGPTWIGGKKGKALNFAGQDTNNNQTVAITAGATNPELAILGDVTVSAWIRPSSSYFDVNEAVMRGGSGADLDYSLFYDPVNQRPYFHWYDGGFPSVAGVTNSVLFNRWSLVTIVRSGLTLSFYVNGAFTNSVAVTAPTVAAAQIAIGRTNNAGVPQDFSGDIDDVRIYNRALSASEVSDLYRQNQTEIGGSKETSISDGLIGYWSMNGKDIDWRSQTVYDRSGAGNNGVTVNTSTTTSPTMGRIGQALSFDGSTSYVQVQGSTSINSPTNLTMSAWVKLAGSQPSPTGITTKEQGDCTNSSYAFEINGFTPNFIVESTGSVRDAVTGSALPTGQWKLVTGVYDGSTASIYIDGTFVSSVSHVQGIKSTAGTFQIGRQKLCSPVRFFNGSIDEVRLYSRALSASEVKRLYNLGK